MSFAQKDTLPPKYISPKSERCNLKMERMTMKTSDNIYEIVPVKN